MSHYYSSLPRDRHDLSKNFNESKSTDIALSMIFDALDEALHKGSYAKVANGKVCNSGIIESYELNKQGETKWELHIRLKGQSSHSIAVYSSALDGNSDVFILTHESVFVLAKKEKCESCPTDECPRKNLENC